MDKIDKLILLLCIFLFQMQQNINRVFDLNISPNYWGVFFYSILSVYFIINLKRELSYTFKKFDRLIIKLSILFFSYFFITEAICIFDIEKFYAIFISESRYYISGSLLIVLIFIILTSKLFRNDKKGVHERQF